MDIPEFCREIETHLCKKNDGHLIRVVGPSFELVSGWAEQGVPLKVALAGIDRYFERYYRNGPRRRPVKIDFCEADVLDVFDEWRRATGVTALARHASDVASQPPPAANQPPPLATHQSLPEHLQRVVARLTAARASGAIGEAYDPIIDRVSQAFDTARARAGGLRGDARRELLAELLRLDAAMLALARAQLDAASLRGLEAEAAVELAPFKVAMAADAYDRARNAALDHLVRTRCNLPTIGYE